MIYFSNYYFLNLFKINLKKHNQCLFLNKLHAKKISSLSSQLFQFVTAQVLNFEHEHVSQILKNVC